MDRRTEPGPGKQLPLCCPVHPGPFPGLPGQPASGDLHALCRMWGIFESKPDDPAGTPEKAWDVGVAWQDGRKFAWKDAMRLNLALPRTRLEEAMRRLSEYVF